MLVHIKAHLQPTTLACCCLYQKQNDTIIGSEISRLNTAWFHYLKVKRPKVFESHMPVIDAEKGRGNYGIQLFTVFHTCFSSKYK